MNKKGTTDSRRVKPNSVFDGFCERSYDEDRDGWIMEQPLIEDYPAVSMAGDILHMYEEIKDLRRENWELNKRNIKMEKAFLGWHQEEE